MEWQDDVERGRRSEGLEQPFFFFRFHFCMTGTAFAYFTTHSTKAFGRVAGVHQTLAVALLRPFSGLSPLRLGPLSLVVMSDGR